jgi:hypothetical protein
MADSYTEVTSRSWFQRLGGAFSGVLVGLLLFVAAFPLLFWNEGRAVKTYKSLAEGEQLVASVTTGEVDRGNEGRLIHLSGTADTRDTLQDPVFPIALEALRLTRTVSMYQWQEHQRSETRKKLGGGEETVTTYSYERGWAERPIDSGAFRHPEGHQNPGAMPYQGQEQTAQTVTLGAFTLSPGLVAKIHHAEPVPPQPLAAGQTGPGDQRITLTGDGYYVGGDSSAPRVGDVRVSFTAVKAQPVSVVARQSGALLEPYHTSVGRDIALLAAGTVGAQEMFSQAQAENTMLTWVLRLAGFVVMFIGVVLVLKPLPVFADLVPFIGSIVGFGTGLVALAVALPLSLVTIAVAWITYRPLLAIGLLVAAVAVAGFAMTRRRHAMPPVPPPA